MTIDRMLAKCLQKSEAKHMKLKWVAIGVGGSNVYAAEVKMISHYLTQEKIRHCTVQKQGIIVIGSTNYTEMQKLASNYLVSITDRVHDDSGENILKKIGHGYSFEPGWGKGAWSQNAPVHNMYNVRKEQVSGSVSYRPPFDISKYPVEKLTKTLGYFTGTFEQFFELLLDEEVIGIDASPVRKLVW